MNINYLNWGTYLISIVAFLFLPLVFFNIRTQKKNKELLLFLVFLAIIVSDIAFLKFFDYSYLHTIILSISFFIISSVFFKDSPNKFREILKNHKSVLFYIILTLAIIACYVLDKTGFIADQILYSSILLYQILIMIIFTFMFINFYGNYAFMIGFKIKFSLFYYLLIYLLIILDFSFSIKYSMYTTSYLPDPTSLMLLKNLKNIVYLLISGLGLTKIFISVNTFIKQLLEYTQSKKGEFKTLDIIQSLVLESEEFDYTLNNILNIAGELTKSDGGMIYTYDKERDSFYCGKINGYCVPPFFVNDKILEDSEEINNKLVKTPVQTNISPLFKKIKESSEIVMIQREGDEDSRQILSSLRDYADNLGSMLCGKIMIDDEIFGVIIIEEQYSNYTITDLNIFRAICSFSGVLIKNIKSKSMEKERERLKNEMKIAEQIQTGILPRKYDIEGFTITAMMKPAEEVGGDYYDILSAPDGNYWLNIGDVTGHGVTAGLIMMMLQTSSTTTINAIPDISPKDLAIICNRIIYENVQNRLLLDQFITTCFMKFNKSGFFEYSGAHEDIYIYRNATDNVEVLKTKGIWLGLMDDISHGTSLSSFNLYKGDVMILFTDGVIEIKNRDNEQYDTKRLINLMKKNGRKHPDEISEILMQELNAFKDVQKDDITYMIIRRD